MSGIGGIVQQIVQGGQGIVNQAEGELARIIPIGNQQNEIKEQAKVLAQEYKNTGGRSYDDCVVVVSAALAAWGAKKGGWAGAAVATGAGIPAARLGCEVVFPNNQGTAQPAPPRPPPNDRGGNPGRI